MPDLITEYLSLTDDNYKPINPKQSLNTRDNYQIYSLYSRTVMSMIGSRSQIDTSDIIAVQKYHPVKPLCDFDAIARQYK